MKDDLTKLADALENIAQMEYPSAHHDGKNLREAAALLRAAAGVDVAGLMAMVKEHALNCYELGAIKSDVKNHAQQRMKVAGFYAALESALRMALAGREEWQPIETAPKDVAVLLWGKYWNNKDVFQRPLVGQWNPISNPQRWEALGEYRFGIRPTHWMPLPAAPKGTP